MLMQNNIKVTRLNNQSLTLFISDMFSMRLYYSAMRRRTQVSLRRFGRTCYSHLPDLLPRRRFPQNISNYRNKRRDFPQQCSLNINNLTAQRIVVTICTTQRHLKLRKSAFCSQNVHLHNSDNKNDFFLTRINKSVFVIHKCMFCVKYERKFKFARS